VSRDISAVSIVQPVIRSLDNSAYPPRSSSKSVKREGKHSSSMCIYHTYRLPIPSNGHPGNSTLQSTTPPPSKSLSMPPLLQTSNPESLSRSTCRIVSLAPSSIRRISILLSIRLSKSTSIYLCSRPFKYARPPYTSVPRKNSQPVQLVASV
jgi:hypothetical protein